MKKNKMKILVVGLGSMGKRRIRNLQSLGYNDVLGYDIKKNRMDESKKKYNIKIFSDIQSALREKPQFIIISTSPDTHIKYVTYAIKNKIPFFTEVNTNPKHIKKIIELMKKNKVKGVSSMTMRFHPAIKLIRTQIKTGRLGKMYFLNYHSGENLEDWHPWEKLTDYYVKSKPTGGGRDQAVFEIEWILWLFGMPKKITGYVDKLSSLPVNIFDIYNFNLSLEKIPLANVVVDVIQKPPNRILRIVCEKGVIIWDWINGFVKIYDSQSKKWMEVGHGVGYKGFNVEEMYQEEIENVIKSIDSQKNFVYTFEEELLAVKTVLLTEKSSKIRKTLEFKKYQKFE